MSTAPESPVPSSTIAVYCGSSPGTDPAFGAMASDVGAMLAERGHRLVYGGGNVGLMGKVADAAIAGGAEVFGVITEALEAREVAHRGITRLDVVETMHQRKAAMLDAADAVLMLPGGFGTLEEFFEALTWTQLEVHAIPCGVLDVNDYFRGLREFLDTAVASRFVSEAHRSDVFFSSDPAALLDFFATWQPKDGGKWLDRYDR
jgi:uncharacterized protein (TIGR00730 family)